MVILIKSLQVILAISFLILIHELGHFAWSKLFHIRVDKFFLFFDIGGRHLFSTKHTKWFVRLFPKAAAAETEYGIGWLPLGGYCKINGMVDESMDLDALKNEPQPWEFRSKAPWKRLLVLAGGVLNNFIFAVLAFIVIMAVWGEAYISPRGAQIYVNSLSYDMGFRTGDEILDLDGYVPEDFSMLQAEIARRGVRKVRVLRGSDTLDIYMDKARTGEVLNTPGMFQLAVPFVVDSVQAGSGNEALGIKRGDRLASLGGVPVTFLQDARIELERYAGGTVEAAFLRGADTVYVPMQVDTAGRAGIYMQMPAVERRSYNIIEAVPAGLRMTGNMVSGYLSDLKMLATPSTGAYKSVGSFIAIGDIFPAVWDWYQFLYILALLSVMLGVMNLIPIPGLDGGHIVFTLYEMITGRKPGNGFLAVAQMIGFLLLFALMALAFGNDIGRFIIK